MVFHNYYIEKCCAILCCSTLGMPLLTFSELLPDHFYPWVSIVSSCLLRANLYYKLMDSKVLTHNKFKVLPRSYHSLTNISQLHSSQPIWTRHRILIVVRTLLKLNLTQLLLIYFPNSRAKVFRLHPKWNINQNPINNNCTY